jgi:aldehyde:ferredoxin oxidoreductase
VSDGYMGKVLWIDLSTGKQKTEVLDERTCRTNIGGYGLGARFLYSRMRAGADPLGPENILGFVTGPLTGTPALSGCRFAVVCKSPLTRIWGDSNCGGDFGPHLKFTGFDAAFFTGASDAPVYLYVENGKPELRDARELWGRDSFETEDLLKKKHGKDTRVACIGPSGERTSLIASIMTNKGRAAGRSGVGAVMGSKNLKAVAVRGGTPVPVADPVGMKDLRKKTLQSLNPNAQFFRQYGTAGLTEGFVSTGISPVKNWGGVAEKDFPDSSPINGDRVNALKSRNEACWHCTLACGGRMQAGTEYSYLEGASKPEYETLAAFGPNCLNSNLESIVMANDICNRSGLDTMSAGATIAFAIECFQRGLISKRDTGGLELGWGDHKAIVTLTDQMARREGFGALLADGSKTAAERIGKNSAQYAIHIAGQEIGFHDTRSPMRWSQVVSHQLDATPARHTQGHEGLAAPGLLPEFNQELFSGRGEVHRRASNMFHVINSLGLCQIMYASLPHIDAVVDFVNAATGWGATVEELVQTGERICNLRHAFNLREGINPLLHQVPGRAVGKPPQSEGPNSGIVVDEETLISDYLIAMKWDDKTCRPDRTRLIELGLEDVASDLYG